MAVKLVVFQSVRLAPQNCHQASGLSSPHAASGLTSLECALQQVRGPTATERSHSHGTVGWAPGVCGIDLRSLRAKLPNIQCRSDGRCTTTTVIYSSCSAAETRSGGLQRQQHESSFVCVCHYSITRRTLKTFGGLGEYRQKENSSGCIYPAEGYPICSKPQDCSSTGCALGLAGRSTSNRQGFIGSPPCPSHASNTTSTSV